MPPVWSRITNLVVDRGEGSWLITTDGERYLDYTSGIGVTNTGHAHPRVVAAIQDQAAKLLHGQQNIVYHEPGLRLYERLAHVLPGGPWSAFLSNSGAEAVEAAVKLARVATGRPAIIAFRYGFHGRTAQAMALTAAKDVYRGAFEPLPGSVYHASYPYCYRASGGAARPVGLHLRLGGAARPAVPPARLPGQGGRRSSSSRSSARAATSSRRRRSCRGCARSPASTGSCSSRTRSRRASGGPARCSRSQHWDVEPDIVVMAKGIASGLPLSGILAARALMDRLPPGSHGGTYGGNVVSVRGGERDARRHRGRGPGRERRASAARSCWTGLRRACAGRAASATSAAWA